MAKKAEELTQDTTQDTNQDTDQDTAQEARPYDPWQDMRQVFVPMMSRGEQNTLEVAVNDRTFFIPKNVMVEVPEPVWEVINEMQRAQRALDDYLSASPKLQPTQGR